MTIEIANRLIKLRKEKGLSQEDLANALGISRQAVSKWERAEASPDTDNLICLAKLYGVSLDEILLEGTEDEDVKVNEEDCEVIDDEGSIHLKDDEDEVIINNKGILIKDGDGQTIKCNRNSIHKYTQNKRNKRGLISNILLHIYPILVVIAYLVLGFTLSLWHPAWILFITIPLFDSLVKAIEKRKFQKFAYPILILVAYLSLGCFINGWHPWWVLFLTIPIYYSIAKPIDNHFHKSDLEDDED